MMAELSFLCNYPFKINMIVWFGVHLSYVTFNTCVIQHFNHLLRAIHLFFNSSSHSGTN